MQVYSGTQKKTKNKKNKKNKTKNKKEKQKKKKKTNPKKRDHSLEHGRKKACKFIAPSYRGVVRVVNLNQRSAAKNLWVVSSKP